MQVSKHARTNRFKSQVSKAPLSKVRVLGALVGVGLVAAIGYAPMATAAAKVTSGQILNQTIGSVDIMPGGVGRSELRKNSVGWSEVQEESLDNSELTNGGVKEEDLDEATQEKLNKPAGEGEQGPKGDSGVSGYEVVGRGADAADVTEADGVKTITTLCADGTAAVGGGANTSGGDVDLKASYPGAIERVGENTEENPSGLWAAKGWTVKVKGTGHVQPFVLCAKLG